MKLYRLQKDFTNRAGNDDGWAGVPTTGQLCIAVVTSKPPSVKHNKDKEMKKSLVLFPLCIATLTVLTACGGGGGTTPSGTTPSATTPSATTDIIPNGQILTITSLTLSPSDVIATTKPTIKTLAIWTIFKKIQKYSHRFINNIIPSSYAVVTQPTYPPLTYDPNFSISRKLLNGNLTRIDPIVKYFEIDSKYKLTYENAKKICL